MSNRLLQKLNFLSNDFAKNSRRFKSSIKIFMRYTKGLRHWFSCRLVHQRVRNGEPMRFLRFKTKLITRLPSLGFDSGAINIKQITLRICTYSSLFSSHRCAHSSPWRCFPTRTRTCPALFASWLLCGPHLKSYLHNAWLQSRRQSWTHGWKASINICSSKDFNGY
jgi:hypothetical protein